MSVLVLRRATPGDADAIADLHAQSWRTTYRGAMRAAYLDGDVGAERRTVWCERLSAPAANQYVVVAEDDDAIVGFGCAYGDFDPVWGTELDNLHVAAAAQGRGVGARLLAAVARWAGATHAAHGLYLWVLDGNHGARRFYDRLGARDVGGDVWHAPDGSALAVRRDVWAPDAVSRLGRTAGVVVGEAVVPADHAAARALFEEYAAWLGEDLCFQGFAAELESIPRIYGPPRGALLVALDAGVAVGCVGVRALADDTCEMKRLYVRDAARRGGLGRALAEAALAAGRRLGHRRMVLDTLERMQAARALYARLGFAETDAYYANPLPGVRYLARTL